MNKQSKKVLITGATGQSGSYMAEYLLENTDNTLILAARRTSQAILSNIEHLLGNPRVKLITLDLMDGEAIRRVIKDEKPDYFVNFGAQTFVSDSWEHPIQHMQINAMSLIHILEAVREYVPQCRVYSAGSSEQFGNDDHQFSPRSIYGVSKCTSQLICKVYRESYGLYVVHGILFNHESPRRQEYFVTRKITKGVARIKKAVECGESFEPISLGNLDARRDWSFAGDFCDGIWRMLNQENYNPVLKQKWLDWESENGFTPGYKQLQFRKEQEMKLLSKNIKGYVLASGETHSIREFCAESFRVAGISNIYWFKGTGEEHESLWLQEYNETKGPIQERLVIVNSKFYRPADVQTLLGDSTVARQELGWNPKVSFKQLVEDMVKSDLKNS